MKQNMASRRERKSEKVRVGPRLRQCEARYETGNCGEFCVRWRGLCALGEGGEEHGRVPRLMLQTELGRYKTKKKRESEGWARVK